MAKTPTAVADAAQTFEPDAHYEVVFQRFVDLGDMKLRPAHAYPYVAGSLLATLPPGAIKSARRVALPS